MLSHAASGPGIFAGKTHSVPFRASAAVRPRFAAATPIGIGSKLRICYFPAPIFESGGQHAPERGS